MLRIVLGISGLFCVVGCGADIAVGNATGGAGAGATGNSEGGTQAGAPAQAGAPTEGGAPAQAGASTQGGGGFGPTGGTGGESPYPCPVAVSDAGADNGSDPLCVTWTDPTSAPDCAVSPAGVQEYSTGEELSALLVGRWRRCIAPQIAGEDVGVEFTADGKYYPLTFNAAHQIVRRTGIDFEGGWTYLPVGTVLPFNPAPSQTAWLLLGGYPPSSSNGVYTGPPQITTNPTQLRITFSPALSKYVPLAP